MNVFIAQPLRSYTDQQPIVQADGETLRGLLDDLDRRFPGIRFRVINEQDEIRPHVVFVVNGVKTRDIEEPLAGSREVVILQALSGG